MPRHAEDFRIFKRSGSHYYFYSLKGWPRSKRRSTYSKSIVQATKVAFEREGQELHGLTLREVLTDYYVWDRCPHIRRLLDENKRMSKLHAKSSRRALELYVLTDPIAEQPFLEISPGEAIDYRSRLRSLEIPTKAGAVKTLSPGRMNRVVTLLYTVYQEEITRRGRLQVPVNPFEGLGKIQYQAHHPGIFTREELASFFPADSLGHWQDHEEYAAFLLAETAGMRRGEVLGLRWRSIDFIRSLIHVVEAVHPGDDRTEVKWGGRRRVPVPRRTIAALKELRTHARFGGDDNYVFCGPAGEPYGETWWRKRFNRFCKAAGIDRVGRNLKPHSFRHSLTTYLTETLQNQGIDPKILNAYLGGWTNDETRKIYTHTEEIILEAQRRAAEELIRDGQDSERADRRA